MEKRKLVRRRTTTKSVAARIEDILGCKWSLTVLGLIRSGVHRPGAMEHATDGLSAKVLNERLRKLVRYGIVDKHTFAELPPRVEYRLTDFGMKLCSVLDQIAALEATAPGPVRGQPEKKPARRRQRA